MTSSVLVFIVEDDELIRQVLGEAFAEAGFAIAMAVTGDEAIKTLDQQGTAFSALITDINLPGKFSGWDVGRHAREIKDTLPVVYMSGASGHDWASKGVPKSQLMPKPFAVAQVVTAISQLINEAAQSL